MTEIHDLAATSNAWPFQEARTLRDRVAKNGAKEVILETGYGPSGLPHIGTFGEVARTTMVRHAFERLSPVKTRLIAFSDDMDGLRKVPDNIPNPEMVRQHLGKPLTRIPDPFGTHESYGHHMNARLQAFLDAFGFQYEFMSATDCYTKGLFDATLRMALEKHEAIKAVIVPTLGAERAANYSPFMPVCPDTGKVLMAEVVETRPQAGTLVYRHPDTQKLVETPVTGGACKMQWKADWAMRWASLGIAYEMYGKDLIPSAELSSKICAILGGEPPAGFSYELFLDEKGQKISKSKGNGLTIDEWLAYAPPESLAYYMYQSPKKAKRLYFDVIPRSVDDYLTFVEKFATQEPEKRLDNPAWHLHSGNVPEYRVPVSFGMLLNLASACNPEDASVLWGFIATYAPGTTPENAPMLDRLAKHAVRYYHDFVRPAKRYRAPTEVERPAFEALREYLAKIDAGTPADDIQNVIYEIGKQYADAFPDLKDWFGAMYQVLLGQETGPRMGSFVALYSPLQTRMLVERALAGEDLGKAA